MNGLLKLGRPLLAIALALFGVEYFIYASGIKGPIPSSPWNPGLHSLAWLTGLTLVAIAGGILTPKLAKLAAFLLGAGLLVNVLLFHAPGLIAHLHSPDPWTGTFELLALCGAAFVLARIADTDQLSTQSSNDMVLHLATAGRLFFAAALIVFAVQHFLYAGFVASLVPRWIPAHLFWAYFTGAAFVASALAIATRNVAQIASLCLGIMFLLLVLILHVPRVAAASRNGDEWTSMVVALAMSGASLILAEAFATDLAARDEIK